MFVLSSHQKSAPFLCQVLPPAAHTQPPPPPRTLAALHPPPPRRLPPPPSVMPRHPSGAQAPHVHSSHQHCCGASTMPATGPDQHSHSSQSSGWDVPADVTGNICNSQSQRQQPKQHAAKQSMHSRDASPKHLSQHLHSLSLQPASQAGTFSTLVDACRDEASQNSFLAHRLHTAAWQVTIQADSSRTIS